MGSSSSPFSSSAAAAAAMFSIKASIKSQIAFTIRSTGRSKSRFVCCSNNNRSSGDGKQQKLQEEEEEDWVRSPAMASPYEILGVDPASSPSAAQLKAAFRARVCKFIYLFNSHLSVFKILMYSALISLCSDESADTALASLNFFNRPALCT